MSKFCPINNLASKDILNEIMPTGMVFDELIVFCVSALSCVTPFAPDLCCSVDPKTTAVQW